MKNYKMIFLIGLRRDNRVGNACFVFQAEKNKTLSSTGSLAGNHGSGDATCMPFGRLPNSLAQRTPCFLIRLRWYAMGCGPTVMPVPLKSAMSLSLAVIGS